MIILICNGDQKPTRAQAEAADLILKVDWTNRRPFEQRVKVLDDHHLQDGAVVKNANTWDGD